jgi:glycosyltransferase involved in cell wall biosynthesis
MSLRVLQVTPRYFPEMGGVETHVYEISRRLAAAGAKVTVLATDRSRQLPPREQVEGVNIVRVRAWPAQRDYYLAPEMAGVINQGGWNVVHCQGWHTFVPPLGMLSAQAAGIPYVLTFHSGGHSSSARESVRDSQRWLLRPLLKGAARLIGVSRFEAELFQKKLRLSPSRFVVIPNGAQLPPLAVPTTYKTERPMILSVGRLEQYKGHQRVIAAFPKVLQQFPGAQLRILGSGPYEGALRLLVQELGIADKVEIGVIPATDRMAMATALARASVVTLLSEYEAHAIAVLEALALGRPVLVADTTGLHELAERGLARAIALDSTPDVVAAALVDQIRQPLVATNLMLPTWDDCAERLLALYQAVSKAGSGPGVRTIRTC